MFKNSTTHKIYFLFLFSKNKVNGVLKDLLGFIPQEKLKFEFTSFLDKLVSILY